MRDAKQAALESIARYLTPDLGQQPTLPSVSLPPQIRPPRSEPGGGGETRQLPRTRY